MNSGSLLLADDVGMRVIVEVRPPPAQGSSANCFSLTSGWRGVVFAIHVVDSRHEPVRPASAKPLNLVGNYFSSQKFLRGLQNVTIKLFYFK